MKNAELRINKRSSAKLVAVASLACLVGVVVGEHFGRASERQAQQAYDNALSSEEFVKKLCNSVWLDWKGPSAASAEEAAPR